MNLLLATAGELHDPQHYLDAVIGAERYAPQER